VGGCGLYFSTALLTPSVAAVNESKVLSKKILLSKFH